MGSKKSRPSRRPRARGPGPDRPLAVVPIDRAAQAVVASFAAGGHRQALGVVVAALTANGDVQVGILCPVEGGLRPDPSTQAQILGAATAKTGRMMREWAQELVEGALAKADVDDEVLQANRRSGLITVRGAKPS